MKGLPGLHDLREEVLERVWTRHSLDALDPQEVEPTIATLIEEGLVHKGNGTLHLTDEGESVARHVVRAHRLAARLLSDLLEISSDSIEGLACRLEHAISPELADSLCTLLGHPPNAPGGDPIPPGRCCEVYKNGVEPLVRQLSDLDLGGSGRITFIHPRFAARLDQLSALGLVPGTDVRLKQRHPSIVLDAGETTIALDNDVARDIFVKPVRT